MSATADQELAELRRAYEEMRSERDAALTALARRNTEYGERIEYQAATIDVLKAMSASPGDPQPVFDLIVNRARDICDAYGATVFEFDGTRVHWRAATGVSDDPAVRAAYEAQFPMVPTQDWHFGRAILDQRIIRIDDLETEPGLHPAVRGITAKSSVTTPIMRGDVVIGAVSMGGREKGGFSDSQVELLKTFAEQAAIAITSAETYRALREALEQQTATAEVLQVINASPGDLTPVFDIILDKAQRVCGVDHAALELYDGECMRAISVHGASDRFAQTLRQGYRVSQSPASQALLEGRPFVEIADASQVDHVAFRTAAAVDGVRTVLFVPLRRDTLFLGMIASARRQIQPFSAKEIALLQNFAAQAVIAIENARLLSEIRQRQEELRVTFENMGDGMAMFGETQHLVAWNGKFQEVYDLPDTLLKQHRTYEEYLRFLADRGDFGAGIDTAEQIHELVASTGQPYGYERTRPDGRVIEIRRNPVPDGGFVLIFSDITERKRSEAEIRAARDAAENALRELRATQASLIQAEKMASLGQLTAGIAHEIKNPLNFVNNFASLSVDLLDELKQAATPGLAVLDAIRRAEVDELTNTLASNLDKINEHGRRADGIVRGMLEHSRGSSGERRLIELNALVDEALNLAYHGARAQDQTFNVTLQRELGEGIAPITLAPQDVTRVLLNLFSNGFYAARERQRTEAVPGFEPTVTVTTRDLDGAVEIRVRDNGVGIPAEIKDRLFQPFFTTKPPGEGTGLGLSMSYDIITQQHGGSITVDSKVGEYSEFTVRLPRTA